MESMEILDVEPLCMIPPKGSSSSSGDFSDIASPKVSVFPGNSAANGLPPGWTVITRAKGNGQPYKVYIEPHTGLKFYSRVKVQEYLQNLTSSKPDQRVQSRRANITSSQRLPPDFVVQIKTKMSGMGAGSKYKIYIEKGTGRKFYSKTQVFEYLKLHSSSSSPEKANIHGVRSENPREWFPECHNMKDEIESDGSDSTYERKYKANGTSSQRLSHDFDVQIKTKMSGQRAGSKYKIYTEKGTGKKFYSKTQVFDYLKLHSSSSPPDHGVRSENPREWFPECHNMKAEIESDGSDSTYERKYKDKGTEIVETNLEGLPMGWFKAIKYGESRTGIHRKTALYVDPTSGYAFFSRTDALRYIDNGHIKDCRVRPTFWSKISENCAGNKVHSQPTSKEREVKPERRKGKRPLRTEESDEGISEEDVIEIDDSDEQSGPTIKERLKRNEENFKKKSDDGVETDDIQMGVEKAETTKNGEEKITETPPLRRVRTKVLASKTRPFLGSCKSSSSETHTSDPSSVCREQTDLKSNEENRRSEQKKVPNEGSSQQVDPQEIRSYKTETSPSATFGKPSLDPSLKFAL